MSKKTEIMSNRFYFMNRFSYALSTISLVYFPGCGQDDSPYLQQSAALYRDVLSEMWCNVGTIEENNV